MARSNLNFKNKQMKQLTGNEYLVLSIIEHRFNQENSNHIYLASRTIIQELKIVKISRNTVAKVLKSLEDENIIKLRRIKGCAHIAYKGKNYQVYISKVQHFILN